jgi:EAL domain-containing protein (putative c-di-GMP-specific phosphodiesterase class I)
MPQSFLSFMVQLSSLQSRLRERPGQALRNLLQTATKDDLVVAFTIRRPSASARAAQRQEALQSAQRALRRALRGKEHVLLPLKEQSLVALAKATPLQRTRLLKLKRAVEAQKVNDMPLQVSVCASQGEGALQEVFEHMLDSPEELRLLGPQELQALRAQVKEATKREAFLKQALRAQQVETFFQPVVGLATGSLYALEALARIKHNPRYLPAGEFIEALYRLDLVRELDRQVTQRTTEFAPLLNTVTARVSINLSPLSLKAPGFGRFLEQAIKTMKEQGIVPLVEITEQVVLEHMELIRHLNFHYGVRVAVDDFGTGYSSLKVVAELAQAEVISHLKIDGSLTTQVLSSEEAYKIVRSTVKMAKSLGLRTVAEYVESRPLAEKLLELEVDYGQGYYFAPPLSVSELMERYAGPPLARA